jgi:hypothetical protein
MSDAKTAANRASLLALVEGITTGKLLDAFDRYYHDDVVMQENAEEDPKRIGKAANRAAEEYFVQNAEFHGVKLGAVIVDGDHSAYEMWMDFSMGGNRITHTQVAVQTWKDGRIVKEVFYYKP